MAEGGGNGRKGILPGNEEITIDAAFLSSNENQAFIFNNTMKKCALFDYTADRVVIGPLPIREMFPILARTPPFGEQGIDCAFKISHESEAFIFCGTQCARLNFETPDGRITRGPLTIALMFPFLVGTVFETGVDAAFKSSNDNEAYLFRGSQCALINYSDSPPNLIYRGPISERFPSWTNNNIFRDRINAAFSTYSNNEVYIFNGVYCALFHFARQHSNDVIVVNEIITVWPCLRGIWSP